MKIYFYFTLLFVKTIFSQSSDSLNYFPMHAGDVVQFRSQFTGEIRTKYFDKDSTDQNKNRFIWYHNNFTDSGIYRIDSLKNLYEYYAVKDTSFLLYALNADTGNVWIYRKSPFDTILAKVVRIFPSSVFGKQVTVKKISYTRYTQGKPFLLIDQYLATRFGLIQWFAEPGDLFVLSGAIINGIKYGTIVTTEKTLTISESFEVLKNYPNPFNNSTSIYYTITKQGSVNLTVFDILGRRINTLMDDKLEKGNYKTSFDGNGLTSGIYFAVLQTASKTLTHKLLLIK